MERVAVNLENIDITNTAMFEEYANFKNVMSYELARLSPKNIVATETQRKNEEIQFMIDALSPKTLKQKADSLIELQKLKERNISLIDYMAKQKAPTYAQYNSLWNPILWQSHENQASQTMNVNGHTIDSFDLDYMIADNLQLLYAGEDPRAEYFDWVQKQHQIEVDINTDGTTEEEVIQRNTFISFLTEREGELRRIITLYTGTALNPKSAMKNSAQEKLKFLTFKLSELRRLRERTVNLKSFADEKGTIEAKQQNEKAQIALASDFILRTSSFLSGKASQEKVLAPRIFKRLEKLNYEELREKIEKRKKQRVRLKEFLQKLRGIHTEEDDEIIQNTVLDHHELQQRYGFSSEQYLQQYANSIPDRTA